MERVSGFLEDNGPHTRNGIKTWKEPDTRRGLGKAEHIVTAIEELLAAATARSAPSPENAT
jgi:hypothetical protein